MRKLLLLVLLLIAAFGANAQGVTASPSSLYSSQAVSASWSGIAAPSATDWIGLYLAGSADNAFVTYVYTNGGASGTTSITVPGTAAAGTYELRLFSNNGYTKLATSNSFTVQTPPPAMLSESPSSIYASQALSATWGAIFAPTATDWIGLYVAGSADNAFVTFVYTNSNASGSTNITVPGTAAAGTYELRLFSHDGYTKLATSGAFTVQTPPPATLSESPSSIYASQAVSTTWGSIFAPTATDWIGVYVAGSADNAFATFVYTDGNASGSTSITVPGTAAAGTYELRLFSRDGYTKLATSGSFTVQTPPPATLAVSPSNVAPGDNATATWSSIFAPTAADWIGLYLPSAADNAFISWRYTTGTAAGSVPFSIPASLATGTYQLRLFSNNGYTRLATSANFTVGVTPPALYFVQVDHLNTPRLIADANQQTVWKWDQQEPFGNNTPNGDPGNTGGVFDYPGRFPGQYADKETNLAYNYFRDYDPSVGRYVESDPIGLVGGVNTYAYVRAKPFMYKDPSGLINFIGGFGGSVVPAYGGEGSIQRAYNPGWFGQQSSDMLTISVGQGVGFNISADAFVGIIRGDTRNVEGDTTNINVGIGPLSITLMYDRSTNDFMGFTVGVGPSPTFIAGSVTNSSTKAILGAPRTGAPQQVSACIP